MNIIGNNKFLIEKSNNQYIIIRNPNDNNTSEILYINEEDLEDFINLLNDIKNFLK